jgi:tetratricopeptide (TPR) repeat protein
MTGRQLFLFSCILLAFSFSAKADENLVELVKKVKPAVVLIQTFDKDNNPLGQGSGFFVNNKGHIVTNHHVIEGAYRATVKTSSGMEYPVEGIIAKNADADIVKLVANIPDANTPFLNLSDIVPSEGQDIVVIGNPLGLESTVSAGIVSAVRDIPAFGKILQITAPISPGSSGSPVVNSKGEVIGVATLIAKSGQNINFAIPADKVLALKEIAISINLSEYLVQIKTSDVNNAQKLYKEGQQKMWSENWLEALNYFKQATQADSQYADAWFSAGCCYGLLGYHAEEVEAYKQTIKIKPDYVSAYNNLASTYRELGQYAEVIDVCKEVIKIKPNNAFAYTYLGDAYMELGHYSEAIEAYKQAIIIMPAYIPPRTNLGKIYTELGRYSEAIEAYKQAIRINPDIPAPHTNLGIAFAKLGRYSEAIEACKQAIRIMPDYAEAYYNLGLVYLWANDKESALETYKTLKTLDTELANKLFNLIYK